MSGGKAAKANICKVLMMKAQIISFDFIASFFLFLLILGMVANAWLMMPSYSYDYGLRQKASSIADYLLAGVIGDESVIDCAKLSNLAFQNYDQLKSGLNSNPYEVWIELEGMNSSVCPAIRRNIDVMLVLDKSGSMAGQKLTDAKNAAKSFVDKLNGSYDQGGLASFSTTASLDQTLLIMASPNKTTLKNKIDSLSANGYTNIGDAIATATTELTSARGNMNAAKIQVLLSDGNPNRPVGVDANQYAIDKAKLSCKSNINIYTISLGSDANRTLMQIIANITHGSEYYAPSSGDLQNIFSNISSAITAASNYGRIADNAKNMASVSRIVYVGGRELRMTVRVYERQEGDDCA
jgi:Mg-chelatase subunit ChlD